MTVTEPRYTLDEARRLLAREICDQLGHDWDVVTNAAGPVLVSCGRCGEDHAVIAGKIERHTEWASENPEEVPGIIAWADLDEFMDVNEHLGGDYVWKRSVIYTPWVRTLISESD